MIGVLHWHYKPDRPASLEAELLTRVYDHPEWRNLLEQNEIDPNPITIGLSPEDEKRLSSEDERKAVEVLLTEIASYFNKIRLFHSTEEVPLKDQYIPVQVTLER